MKSIVLVCVCLSITGMERQESFRSNDSTSPRSTTSTPSKMSPRNIKTDRGQILGSVGAHIFNEVDGIAGIIFIKTHKSFLLENCCITYHHKGSDKVVIIQPKIFHDEKSELTQIEFEIPK